MVQDARRQGHTLCRRHPAARLLSRLKQHHEMGRAMPVSVLDAIEED
jgi:hypothetical protein